jgi:DNA-binding transcriptional LysR family regulator
MMLTQLRAFHAVASEGSFTRGALRLGISQPAVTVQVKALEQRYGVELFHRQGQRIELTASGRELWQRTRRVFAELDDLEAARPARGPGVLRARRRAGPRPAVIRSERAQAAAL